MRKLVLTLSLLLALGGATGQTAEAHIFKPKCKSLKCLLAAQTESLAHAKYVAIRGSGKTQQWHRKQIPWLTRELRRTEEKLHPTNWRLYLKRLVGPIVYYGCALPLIGRESGGVVVKWNYQGSGAYGLGQAKPASKMAPYGSDYMTNGVTQIRWMHSYVNKYGGWCGANAFQLAHNWY